MHVTASPPRLTQCHQVFTTIFIIATRLQMIATKFQAVYKSNTYRGRSGRLPLSLGELRCGAQLDCCVEFASLLGATAVAGGTASQTQQGLASLVQTSASIFHRYKVVVAVDETTWSRPLYLVAQRQTRIVRDSASSVQGRRS